MTRAYWITVAHSQVWLRNSVHPSRSSVTMPAPLAAANRRVRLPSSPSRPPPSDSSSGIVPVMPIAHKISAHPGPSAATTRPADAAPVICPVFIASRLIELPSCSSASGTICGSSACEAG